MRVRKRTIGAMIAISGLLLAGCAQSGGNGGTTGDAGESLGWGSSKEDYIAAFEDVDPIEIVAQAPGSPESALGARDTLLWDAIEEWSGGKIQVDAQYNLALAPYIEIDDAMRDGRIDSAGPLPTFKPQQYPVSNEVANAAVIVSASPSTDVMVLLSLMNDLMYDTPTALAEFEENGLVPLVAHQAPGTTSLACTGPYSSLDDLAGRTLPSSNEGQTAAFDAWGANSVSLPFVEVFEGLQRGVVDCNPSNSLTNQSSGVVEIAPHLVAASGGSLAAGWGTMMFSKDTWDSLPVLAQQLIFDLHLSVYLPETVKAVWSATADIAELGAANGGGYILLEDDAQEALDEVNSEILDEVAASDVLDGAELVERATERNEFWVRTIEELGFESDVSYDDLADWTADHQDFTAWVEILYSEIWAEHRPDA